MRTHDHLVKKLMRRPGVRAEVERMEREESALLDALLAARQEAGLTQGQVAARMGTHAPAVARLERALASGKLPITYNTPQIRQSLWQTVGTPSRINRPFCIRKISLCCRWALGLSKASRMVTGAMVIRQIETFVQHHNAHRRPFV